MPLGVIFTLIGDTITEAGCRKRQEAVNFARASVGLEGFEPSKVAEEYAARLIAGKIDLADFVKPRPPEQL